MLCKMMFLEEFSLQVLKKMPHTSGAAKALLDKHDMQLPLWFKAHTVEKKTSVSMTIKSKPMKCVK